MCDADYCFTLVDIGAQGRNSDGGVFNNSLMGQLLREKRINIPEHMSISLDRPKLPHVLVADEAFPLTEFMMRPYPGKDLNSNRRIYNYRHSRARRCIENCFGIYASRWRIFRKPINCSLETVDGIIKSTVCLHNFLKKYERCLSNAQRRYCPNSYVDTEDELGNLVLGEWRTRECFGMENVARTGANFYSKNASIIRDELCEYFNDEGVVAFQWNCL